jgi:hypothetical protein
MLFAALHSLHLIRTYGSHTNSSESTILYRIKLTMKHTQVDNQLALLPLYYFRSKFLNKAIGFNKQNLPCWHSLGPMNPSLH